MLSPKYDGSIFRNDAINLLAKNVQSASIGGVTLMYDAGGYASGLVLALNTTSNQYQRYVPSGASGTGTAVAILLDKPPSDNVTASGTLQLRAVFKGEVFKSACSGLDTNAETNLGGHEYLDFSGSTIFTF